MSLSEVASSGASYQAPGLVGHGEEEIQGDAWGVADEPPSPSTAETSQKVGSVSTEAISAAAAASAAAAGEITVQEEVLAPPPSASSEEAAAATLAQEKAILQLFSRIGNSFLDAAHYGAESCRCLYSDGIGGAVGGHLINFVKSVGSILFGLILLTPAIFNCRWGLDYIPFQEQRG